MIGIYEIINIVNGKRYIGSSINIDKRIKTHKRQLKKGIHHSIILQKAYDKYKEESFEYRIICKCNKEHKQFIEQLYLDSMKPEYNISKSSKCPMLGRKHTKEAIDKFKTRKVAKGKNHYLYNKTWSTKQRKRILESRKENLKPRSVKSRKNMSNIAKEQDYYDRLKDYIESNKRQIIDNFGNTYESLTDASEKIGVSIQSICDNLKGRTKLTKGKYILEYVDMSKILK